MSEPTISYPGQPSPKARIGEVVDLTLGELRLKDEPIDRGRIDAPRGKAAEAVRKRIQHARHHDP